MKLTESQRERYSRMLALRDFSEDDMKAVIDSTVTVVGAGGLGSPALRLLTAVGFGKIRIIDRDIVELSNIQRQTIYNTEDIGNPKALVAAVNLGKMNPEVQFDSFPVSIQDENAIELLKESDVIIDGMDSFKARRVVNRASLRLGIPYIFAGAIEYYANLSTFVPGETGCLHCLMGDAEDNPDNTCERVGVSPTLLSLAASVQVDEAIRIVSGRKPLLANRLMTIDSFSLSFDFFDIGRVENCPQCSTSGSQAVESTTDLTVTPLCSQSFNISPSGLQKVNLEKISNSLDPTDEFKLSKSFLVVKKSSGAKITIMATGSAIIKGVDSEEEALKLYRTTLSEEH
jgi:molybdopterin/thiamine biosynthesis adenylyltransferase